MTEQSGDRVDAHAPVDGLGGEGVAELVGGDVPDAGLWDRRLNAVDTRSELTGRLCSSSSRWDRSPVGRWWSI